VNGQFPIPSSVSIVLASTSPRRRELLSGMLGEGWSGSFRVVSPGLDDADLPMGCGGKLSLSQWVGSLAYLKARAGADALRRAGESVNDCVVIGADTLVDQDGEVLSKAIDAADAERMIKLVRGRSHEVLTGVALVHPGSGRRDVYTDRATVTVGWLTDETITAYAAGDKWKGKSGAYNLDEQLVAGWPLKTEGDPGCVVGLPTRSLLPRLRAFLGGLPDGRKGAAA
jgi:septum formation protein